MRHLALMRGSLVENRIIIWDIADSRRLFADGYYGKPVGIAKPKPEEIDAPLVLDLIEGLYLLSIGRINVHQARRKMTADSLLDVCRREYGDFDKKYAVYKEFRDLGYVVNSGIKFGCDFAVYKRGPGIDHAPYMVHVYGSRTPVTSTGLVLAGRLATSVKKQFILAVPRRRGVDFMSLDWWRA